MDRYLWLSEQLHSISEATSQPQMESRLLKVTQELGFEFFAFGLRCRFPLAAPKTEMVNNYPQLWQQKYFQNDYLAIDPTVHHGLNSITPVIWNEQLFSDCRPMWEEANAFGLKHGWAQACRCQEGNIGMLTLARSGEKISDVELQSRSPILSWLTQLSFSGFSKFLLTDQSKPLLTCREIEALKWAGEGKTSWEISVILSVSERTVNFHINNAIKKMKVTNKTAAVVQAVILGLI